MAEGLLYVDDPSDLAAHLGLVHFDASRRGIAPGVQLRLMQPASELVFEGAEEEKEVDSVQFRAPLKYVAYSQLAVELLSGAGRQPQEGEALVERMKAHEPGWRQGISK